MNPIVYDPLVTYRLQMHKGFGFVALKNTIPYLTKLGIKTIYASPIFSATPGSEHGYDGMDPLTINPEIGTLEELYEVSALLKENRMGWIQDFVPNHMAFSTGNKWLMDVLEKGQRSHFSKYFDIQWDHPETGPRIMVPFFGDPVEDVISKGELKIKLSNNKVVADYLGTEYPLNISVYSLVLDKNNCPPVLSKWLRETERINSLTNHYLFNDQWDLLFYEWQTLLKNKDVNFYVKHNLDAVNDNAKLISEIMDEQHYLPCHWSKTDSMINYRRFFTVNGLICMNIQDEEVFKSYHSLLKKLCDDEIINGVRVDHIDGLYDPGAYLEKLADHIGRHKYLVVEKILEEGEALEKWPVAGSTGYEFLANVNNVFTNGKNKNEFDEFYQRQVDSTEDVTTQVYEKKTLILEKYMQGELDNLVRLFTSFNLIADDTLHVFDKQIIRNAISAFLIHCPVYRFYFQNFPLKEHEQQLLQDLFSNILKNQPALGKEVALLEHVFLDRPKHNNQELNISIKKFFTRCMQFSGPLMAKGVEDTLMYTFNRFIGHNEVGDAPSAFGISMDEFHKKMLERQQQWPQAMNGTATHDTKRGEDSRARLNVITDIPELWFSNVEEWQGMNAKFKRWQWPDKNDEYFIYQTILAHFPLNENDLDSFPGRLTAYLEKAFREAKLHTNWAEPNSDFENVISDFANAILNKQTEFYKSFTSFLADIIDHGLINSLSQLILKFTCPGAPDVYQGCENWDFSFVDPDNRRPVDYELFESVIKNFDSLPVVDLLQNELWASRNDGHVKSWFVKLLASLRADNPDLFSKGIYKPVKIEGRFKENVLAFIRENNREWLLVVVPLHTASMQLNTVFDKIDWSDTIITLPIFSTSALNLLCMDLVNTEHEISLDKIFNTLPFALLKGKSHSGDRKAGLLLPISSLPSEFGIGDLGPGAYRFADFLHRSNQRIWQLLPLNPVEEGQGFSPYSSISSRAGNTLFISPELLEKDGLISSGFLKAFKMESASKVDFINVEKNKKAILDKAWENYLARSEDSPVKEYDEYCKSQRKWLPDFALYCVIRNQHMGKPWFQWEEKLKNRDGEALKKFEAGHLQELNRIKWEQFIFNTQWRAFKTYCNNLDIKLFGDLPFYVSHDSVDVWANQEIFKLDKDGKPLSIAGVPPDFFSEEGQLWGMPVFRWNVLRKNGFAWWAERLNRNVELFDLVRLDHFRAFSAYWEVPANEKTASNGNWKKAPGDYFFREIKKRLGKLPFVAEDLGEIDDPVYKLRDKFNFPGMKVLQFAFGNNMASSIFIPHNFKMNFIAYTGTHDNNTLAGWFEELNDEIKKQVELYTGQAITFVNVFDVLGRSLYASVADTVIFPVQDILRLGSDARMNLPSKASGNWSWRLLPDQLTNEEEELLKQWTMLYNR